MGALRDVNGGAEHRWVGGLAGEMLLWVELSPKGVLGSPPPVSVSVAMFGNRPWKT